MVFGSASGFGSTINAGGYDRRVIDLSTLTAAQGFSIQGDVADGGAGRSVSSAGDFNGDGFDDLIVSAPYGDDSGEAYVVFGSGSGFGTDVGGRQVIDLTSLSAAQGFVIKGDEAADQAGVSVSSAGDFNGDGFDDLIVGAYGDDGGSAGGEAYVVFGTGSGFGTMDSSPCRFSALEPGFIIQGDLGRHRRPACRRRAMSMATASTISSSARHMATTAAPTPARPMWCSEAPPELLRPRRLLRLWHRPHRAQRGAGLHHPGRCGG